MRPTLLNFSSVLFFETVELQTQNKHLRCILNVLQSKTLEETVLFYLFDIDLCKSISIKVCNFFSAVTE